MGWDVGETIDNVADVQDAFSDLMEGLASGDLSEIASSALDLAGEAFETAAPVVGLFNPAAGAAFAVAGSVLDAVEDGKITMGEVFNIGKTVLESAGIGQAIGSGLETVAGVNAIAEKQVLSMIEKQINGEGITQDDVNILRDLINLLNNENMKRAERKKNGTNASEGAGGAEGAGGSEGAGGGSIFELIAQIFGDKMKKALGRMRDLANQIEQADDDDVAKLTPQFTAAAQEFSFLSQSFNTGINALGEGLKSAARKQ
ncbi:MAG: hypothetical protein ACR2RD_00655 [Woeseiaceae bacterium]